MAFGYDAIVAELAATYLAETGQATPFLSGETELHAHEATAQVPRVVLLHRGGTHEPAQRSAAGEDARDVEPMVSVAVETLQAECVADSDDNADQLWLNVCALLRNLYGDAIQLTNIDWLTQNERVASGCLTTSVKRQTFRFLRPVSSTLIPLGGSAPPRNVVTVKLTDHSVKLGDDDLVGCGHTTPDEPWVDP